MDETDRSSSKVRTYALVEVPPSSSSSAEQPPLYHDYSLPVNHAKIKHIDELERDIANASNLPADEQQKVVNEKIDSLLKLNNAARMESTVFPSAVATEPPPTPFKEPPSLEQQQQPPPPPPPPSEEASKEAPRPRSTGGGRPSGGGGARKKAKARDDWVTGALRQTLTSKQMTKARSILGFMRALPDVYQMDGMGNFSVGGSPQNVNVVDLIATMTSQREPPPAHVELVRGKLLARGFPVSTIANKKLGARLRAPSIATTRKRRRSSTPAPPPAKRKRAKRRQRDPASPPLRYVDSETEEEEEAEQEEEQESEGGEEWPAPGDVEDRPVNKYPLRRPATLHLTPAPSRRPVF